MGREYLYKIDDIIETQNGKIKILDCTRVNNGKNNTRKGYSYICLIDGNIDTISESDLKNKSGCNVCSGRKTLKGINDIATTHPNLIMYLNDIDDGYRYSHGSENKILVVCPDCGYKREIFISNLCRRGFSCTVCGDKVSYPEKFFSNLLQQLQIDFQYQKSDFTWSKDIKNENKKLCGNKIYDFYIPLLDCIIETNGEFHYTESKFNKTTSKTLNDIKDNDKLKKNLAQSNGISSYIEIDCRISELNFIKDSIINSEFAKLFNLENIDWECCARAGFNSLVKTVSNYWNDGKEISEIAQITKLNRGTVRDYLKKGTSVGFCIYNVDEEIQKRIIKSTGNMNKNNEKQVMCLNDNKIFNSIKELTQKSLDIYGVYFYAGYISEVCNNKKQNYKGYKFEFINE